MPIRCVSDLALEESKMHKCTPSLEFSELFPLKSIYVKYKNAVLSHMDCFLLHMEELDKYACTFPDS